MTLLPILLFILGIICFIWAMKMGNTTTKSSQEILTILQGLAGVKKEISQVHKGLREVKAQIGDHELRLIRNENVQTDLCAEVNAQKMSMNAQHQSQPNPTQPQMQSAYASLHTHNKPIFHVPAPYSQLPKYHQDSDYGQSVQKHVQLDTYAAKERQIQEEQQKQSLPEKYQWVVELYNQGWSIPEIAGHLAISRDAVSMVLRTAPKGKGLDL